MQPDPPNGAETPPRTHGAERSLPALGTRFKAAANQHVWATRQALPADLRRPIRDAFLGLSPSDPEHAALLAGLDTKGFLPAFRTDFAEVAAMVVDLRAARTVHLAAGCRARRDRHAGGL